MAGEAASALGLSMAVLAEHPDDAACGVAAEVVLGSPFVAADLRAFAARCDVLTFDHEQVDLELVAELAAGGAVVRPGAATLELAVDKARMRTVLDEAGVPVPAYLVVDEGPGALDAVERFAAAHGWPVMIKAARGRLRRQGRLARRRPGRGGRRAGGRGRAGRRGGAAPAQCRAGRRGGPASLGRIRGLAGGRDGAGGRGLPGGARAGSDRAPTCSTPRRPWARRWPRSPAASASWPWSSSGRGAGCWSTRWRRGPTTRATGRWRVPSRPSSRTTCGRCWTCRWGPPRPSTPRWPASTSSAAPTAPIPPSSSPGAWPSRAPTSTSMARGPGRDANWGT